MHVLNTPDLFDDQHHLHSPELTDICELAKTYCDDPKNDRWLNDLSLDVDLPPTFIVAGRSYMNRSHAIVDKSVFTRTIEQSKNTRFIKKWEVEKEVDFHLRCMDGSLVRVHMCETIDGPSASMRFQPPFIRRFSTLGLPPYVLEWVRLLKQGLIIIAGPVGSGKTTLLHSLIGELNSLDSPPTVHGDRPTIMIVEDPMEATHPRDGKAIIRAREIGTNATSYEAVMHGSLRQRPQVFALGEARTNTTVESMLQMGEYASLVLASLHANGAPDAIRRIVSSFPPTQQNEIKSKLASTLRAVIYITLVPTVTGTLIPAYELLVNCESTKANIEAMDITQLENALRTNNEYGMCALEDSLIKVKNLISPAHFKAALARSDMPTLSEIEESSIYAKRLHEELNLEREAS